MLRGISHVLETTVTMSSWVHHSCHAQYTVFLPSSSWSRALGIFLIPLPWCTQSLEVKAYNIDVLSYLWPSTTDIYFLHFDHLWVSTSATVHCRKTLLWWGLGTVPVSGYRSINLESNLVCCPLIRITVVASFLGPVSQMYSTKHALPFKKHLYWIE